MGGRLPWSVVFFGVAVVGTEKNPTTCSPDCVTWPMNNESRWSRGDFFFALGCKESVRHSTPPPPRPSPRRGGSSSIKLNARGSGT